MVEVKIGKKSLEQVKMQLAMYWALCNQMSQKGYGGFHYGPKFEQRGRERHVFFTLAFKSYLLEHTSLCTIAYGNTMVLTTFFVFFLEGERV